LLLKLSWKIKIGGVKIMNLRFIYKKKGMAIVIALVLAVVFTMFTVMVMNLKNAAYKSSKRLNRNLRAYYLALSASQHALLKIKELRQYFYDALSFGYSISSGNINVNISGGTPGGTFTHPVTQTQTAIPGGVTVPLALRYIDIFKCDIMSYTYYPSEAGNYGEWPFGNCSATPSGNKINSNLQTSIFNNSVSFSNTTPGWISISTWGDPFDGEYHLSNLRNANLDVIDRQNSFSTTSGIAEVLSLSNNTVNFTGNYWIRSGAASPLTGQYLAEDGLIRFSTRIIDTGVQNDSSDDTEEDSLQIICVGEEIPYNGATGPVGNSPGEPNLLGGSAGSGTQIVRLKKIEKIERRIGS
jgi:hypothetical protein